jgi:hypothetical protein
MRYTFQIDGRTTLCNDEIQISYRTILSLAEDAARRILLRLVLRLNTMPLLLSFSNPIRLLHLPQNSGSSVILLAFIAIIFLLYHVTGMNSNITRTGNSSQMLLLLSSATARTKAPSQGQILQSHTLMMLYL